MKTPVILGAATALAFLMQAYAQDSAPSQSAAWQKQILDSQGVLHLPAGSYALDETVLFDLASLGAAAIQTDGPVTITMRGPGPAFRFIGTHEGSADPKSFKPETWKERMPLIDGIAIIGAHPEADGIELNGTVQPIVSRVSVRNARHGIHLVNRNRNVIISGCQIYDNSGIGLFLDDVNLHQINVSHSHISYNRQGGIVVKDGNVRNLQVSGCDIEANMPGDETPTQTANILIHQTGMEGRSIAEVAITGCTIQHSAHYGKGKIADGGANIRIIGTDEHLVNMVTIGHNVMSDTSTHVHLIKTSDVTITGNTFFTTEPMDLLVEDSRRVVIQGNAFNPREDGSIGGIVLRRSAHCLLSGLTIHDFQNEEAAIRLDACQFCRISDSILSDNRKGILLENCTGCVVRDLTVTGLPAAEMPVTDLGGKENSIQEILRLGDAPAAP